MLTLSLIADSPIPFEADVVAPDRLASLTLADIGRLPVQHGNTTVALGDVFRIAGDPADRQVRIEGDCRRIKMLGSKMAAGRLEVHGNVGMHTGADMTGGEIHIQGDAGDWLGAEMSGGRIRINGSVGHQLGAGYRGARHGMTGGTILVDGNAGNEVGAKMRRGMIAVAGSVGDFAGVDLIAGSVFVFGKVGLRPGAGLKRGTLALFGGATPLLPTFCYSCEYDPVFVRVYLARLASAGFAAADIRIGTCRRYCGDRIARGNGEILVWN